MNFDDSDQAGMLHELEKAGVDLELLLGPKNSSAALQSYRFIILDLNPSTNMQELIALAPEVYEGNKARGFWEEGKNRNFGEATMLIITELAEAVEGHRKGRSAGLIATELLTEQEDYSIEIWKDNFEKSIKDSWQDEIADAVIRILDTTYGFEIKLTDLRDAFEGEVIPDNFSEMMLGLTRGISDSFYGPESKEEQDEAWSLTLSAIQIVADKLGLDLFNHVKLKLKYNGTRPFKHGKKY